MNELQRSIWSFMYIELHLSYVFYLINFIIIKILFLF